MFLQEGFIDINIINGEALCKLPLLIILQTCETVASLHVHDRHSTVFGKPISIYSTSVCILYTTVFTLGK